MGMMEEKKQNEEENGSHTKKPRKLANGLWRFLIY
mgnify:CR=1 FL=1